MPERVQLRRVKGWKMPADTMSVARPSRWGNPYPVQRVRNGLVMAFDWAGNPSRDLWEIWRRDSHFSFPVDDLAVQMSVDLFRRLCERFAAFEPRGYRAWLDPLRGQHLACYCPLAYPDGSHHPCHADVLLELANDL